jgi:hypothetical protein
MDAWTPARKGVLVTRLARRSESMNAPAPQGMAEQDYQDWFVEFSDGLKRSIPPLMVQLKDLERTADEAKNRGDEGDVDLFSSIYRYQSEDPNVGPVIGGFVFDLDDAKNPERARKEAIELVRYLKNELGVKEESIDICFSGSKGFSLAINRRVFEFEPSELLPLVHKSMAKEIVEKLDLGTADLVIYERRRLWRLPNTRNSKSMLYKIRITSRDLENLSIDEIRRLASSPSAIIQKGDHRLSEQANAFYIRHRTDVEEELSKKLQAFSIVEFKGSAPQCIRTALEKGVDEGRRNSATFELAVFLARSGKSEDEIKASLLSWNKLNRPPMDEKEIERTIESAYQGVREDRYGVGCGNVTLAEHCDAARCQYRKGEEEMPADIREEAEALLRDPKILERILKISEKRLVGDESIRKLEILVMASCYGVPLNLNLSQVWSSGRSTITSEMVELMPEGSAWFLAGLSPTGLVHERGEWDEAKKAFIVDLDKKLLAFLENPDQKTVEKLRPLLSHDRYEIMYRFTDRTSKGKLKTLVSILRGWPAVIFCGRGMPATEEYSSRWITASPSVSVTKIGSVIDRKGLGYKTPKIYEKGRDYEVVRAAFRILGEGERRKVVVKFADTLAKHFRRKSPTDMRRFDHFMQLVLASATLHALQRERNEEGEIKAQIEDARIAYDLFHRVEATSIYGVGEHLLDFWEVLKELSVQTPSIDVDEARAAFAKNFGKPITRRWLRDQYLDPLEGAGMIDLVEDTEDKRRKKVVVLRPVVEPLLDFQAFERELKETSPMPLTEVELKAEKGEEPEEESATKEVGEQKTSPTEGRTCGECVHHSHLACSKHPDWVVVTMSATFATSCEFYERGRPRNEM